MSKKASRCPRCKTSWEGIDCNADPSGQYGHVCGTCFYEIAGYYPWDNPQTALKRMGLVRIYKS